MVTEKNLIFSQNIWKLVRVNTFSEILVYKEAQTVYKNVVIGHNFTECRHSESGAKLGTANDTEKSKF